MNDNEQVDTNCCQEITSSSVLHIAKEDNHAQIRVDRITCSFCHCQLLMTREAKDPLKDLARVARSGQIVLSFTNRRVLPPKIVKIRQSRKNR
jgi:hypothetical protein